MTNMRHLMSVPGGLGASAPVDPLTTLLNPWTSGIAVANAPKLKRAEGAAARDMAMLLEAQEAKARAERQAEQDRAFRLMDAMGQLGAARSNLQRRHATITPMLARIQSAYAFAPGMDQAFAVQAASGKEQADDIITMATAPTATAVDAEGIMGLTFRVQSMNDAMDRAVGLVADAAGRAEAGIFAWREAQAAADRAKRVQVMTAQDQERGKIMEFFLNLGRTRT